MKKLIAALLISSVLLPIYTGSAYATSGRICTSESREAEVPSGTQTDANGRTWIGFKAGGLPPDSLSKSSESVTCVEDDR